MKMDVEDLLREGMERFTEEVCAPAGLAHRAARARRRRMAVRASVAAGTAVVTAAAVIAVTGAGTGPGIGPGIGSVMNARDTAYVIGRVDHALAAENFVIAGQATATDTFWIHGHRVHGVDGPTSSWTYGRRVRTEEFTGRECGHALPSGDCTHHGGNERYLADGTALVHGKLTGAYVTFYDRKYSLYPLGHSHLNACSATAQLQLGGPAVTESNWPAFLRAMLGCTSARVTGHTWIGGRKTAVINGLIDVALPRGYARIVREPRVRVRYTLYVDSATYLPVRAYGSTETYGGPSGPSISSFVSNVRWLPPTKANIAKALVTIPRGYRQVSSPADR